jgi:opacity protein-like surface antigen
MAESKQKGIPNYMIRLLNILVALINKINNTRKYRMKIKLLVAVAATVVASSAMAQSAFEGAYGQLGVGYQSSKGKTDIPVNFDSTNGFASVVAAGYNFSISKEFLLGIGAEYSFVPTSEANLRYTDSDTGLPGTEKYKNQNTYNIFLSPGYAISKDSLAYAKVGYTGTSYKFANGTDNLTGYSLGLGYKQIINGGLYGFAEGNYLSYGNKTTDSGIKLSGNSMNLLVGVGYKF